MQVDTTKWQLLFKKYRLKSEFSTLSELGLALSEKGLIYEDSIFSHWQKGTRIPQSRHLLLKLIEIFSDHQAITTLDQANEFLAAAGQGYLSEDEQQRFHFRTVTAPFQVPHEINNFSGREKLIQHIIEREDTTGEVILLHGPAGIGKTALAIKLGHLLRPRYPDGVLWYKIEEDNVMDILLSIARVLGEDIQAIDNIHVRATIVRTLLANKRVLLILDSAELADEVPLLLPNAPNCTTIITSQKHSLPVPLSYITVAVPPFTRQEVVDLFRSVLKEKYPKKNETILLQAAERVGNLPLAIHIFASQLLHEKIQTRQLPEILQQEHYMFQELWEKDKRLRLAINLSYGKLNQTEKSVLVSASIFQGKDFSLASIGYINDLSSPMTQTVLGHLIDLSLVEHSTKNRYRIHPVIREFVHHKLDTPRSSVFLHIACYIFIFFAVWWIYLNIFVDKGNIAYALFAGTYGILPSYGGICGIRTAKNWGGESTLLGKAIFLFSVGLFFQEFGQLAYGYYTNIQSIPVPYPSIGDIGYFGTIPLYIYGTWLLAKSSGIRITVQVFQKKMIAFIIPLLLVMTAYLLFLHDYIFDWSNLIKTFLDIAYPLGEAIYISLAIITFIFSRSILDGIMRSKALLILVALFIQFLADYSFLYDTKNYYQGNFVDFIYLTAYFAMTIALLSLRSIKVKIKNT